jgi:hypothetical protein
MGQEGHDQLKENQHPHYHKYVFSVRSELQDSTVHNYVTLFVGLIMRIVPCFSLLATILTVLIFHRLQHKVKPVEQSMLY